MVGQITPIQNGTYNTRSAMIGDDGLGLGPQYSAAAAVHSRVHHGEGSDRVICIDYWVSGCSTQAYCSGCHSESWEGRTVICDDYWVSGSVLEACSGCHFRIPQGRGRTVICLLTIGSLGTVLELLQRLSFRVPTGEVGH
ncbi:hypothetical protein AVEN_157161-1 [Araneus ventricosus]|uniref:Uncharacterized protein n=1 Tax=Araneus ventricosus TaxID=182803 RepID=A0A4Y2KP62_ARAVE|nr:hypothetical protein AVEN_157161-1 [Araneus ventricosus]